MLMLCLEGHSASKPYGRLLFPRNEPMTPRTGPESPSLPNNGPTQNLDGSYNGKMKTHKPPVNSIFIRCVSVSFIWAQYKFIDIISCWMELSTNFFLLFEVEWFCRCELC